MDRFTIPSEMLKVSPSYGHSIVCSECDCEIYDGEDYDETLLDRDDFDPEDVVRSPFTYKHVICPEGEGVKAIPRFPKTFCSQCGSEFGPGNEGFSSCSQHQEGRVA